MEYHRVNQLDALLLDKFYQEKILEKVLKGFPYDNLKRFLASIAIRTLYFYSSLWTKSTTEGNTIYNLNYIRPGIASLFVHYLAEIFSLICENFESKLGSGIMIWNLASLANWVIFLIKGDYRSLPERIGQVRMELRNKEKSLNIDYFYTQRAIFFNILSDAAKVILPQLQLERVLQYFNSEANLMAESGDACIICGDEEIVSPCGFSGCSHTACYYCYMEAGKNCSQCGK